MMLLASHIRLFFIIVLVAGGFLLSGCIKATSPATRFYVLNPLDSDVDIVSNIDLKGKLSVEISSVHLPQYLERPQIVTRSGGNRLELAEFDQWGGNLRKNMIRVLAKNLSQVLATPDIVIFPNRTAVPPHFRVELEVMQFERDADGKVKFSVQWRLARSGNRKPLVIRITDLVSPRVPPEAGFEYTVKAMSTLVGELSQIIGQEILNQVQARSDP